MSSLALTLVLAAAVMHASWNAMVKGATDRGLVIAAVAMMHAAGGAVLIFSGPPPASGSWPMIAASTLIHYLYYALLFQAYKLGDLSQVYPISRGLSPALVAGGAFVFIGENLAPLGWAGLTAICTGIAMLAFQRRVDADRRAVGVAVVLGVTIAAYSISDGIGVRASGSPTGYSGWLFLLESPVTLAVLLARRRAGTPFHARTFMIGMVGGVFAFGAYAVVLYAATIAPLGAVSAVRESSVVVAALIGVVIFGERPWRARLLSAAVVAAGVIALAFSR